MKELIVILIASLCAFKSVCAPFQNLDFEAVNTNTSRLVDSGFGYAVGHGPISDLLPGWQLSFEGLGLSELGYNSIGSDFGAAGIISRDAYRYFVDAFGSAASTNRLNVGPPDVRIQEVVSLARSGPIVLPARGFSRLHLGSCSLSQGHAVVPRKSPC